MSDIELFKKCMGKFATGVTVITIIDPHSGEKIGVTINSFSSVSLDPLLVLFSLKKQCYCYDAFLASTHFTINILSSSQEDVAMLFTRPFGPELWTDLVTTDTHTSTKSPIIKNAISFIECEKYEHYEGGDHTIFVGRVINMHDYNPNNDPLLYYRGAFRKLG